MDTLTIVLIGVIFILTVLLILAGAVIRDFGRRGFEALPAWARDFLRNEAPGALTAIEGRVDEYVLTTPTKVDDELWAELKPRIRELLQQIIAEEIAAAQAQAAELGVQPNTATRAYINSEISKQIQVVQKVSNVADYTPTTYVADVEAAG